MSLAWSLAVVPLLIALNGLFVAAEYAVIAISPAQVEALRARGKRRTVAAIGVLKAGPARAIGTIQVCITMTNLLLGWIGEPAMSAVLAQVMGPLIRTWPLFFTGLSTALSFLVVTLLTVVFSELLPKALTLRFAAPAAVLTAGMTVVIQRVAGPLVWLMNALANAVTRPLGLGRIEDMDRQQVTAEEVRLLTAQAADAGALSGGERSLILNALALGRRPARQIMVPRVKVAYLDLRWSMDQNRKVMDQFLFSRLPLCDGGLDHVVGVIHTKEFLTAYHAAGDSSVLSLLARRPVFAPETLPLDRLLALFHEQRSQMVFLVDEHGGVEGIVTLRDVMDELVARGAAGTAPADALVPGDAPLHELDLPPELLPAGVVTVSGLLAARVGHIPRSGESVSVGPIRVEVVESDGRAVRWARLRRPAKADYGPDDSAPPGDSALASAPSSGSPRSGATGSALR